MIDPTDVNLPGSGIDPRAKHADTVTSAEAFDKRKWEMKMKKKVRGSAKCNVLRSSAAYARAKERKGNF